MEEEVKEEESVCDCEKLKELFQSLKETNAELNGKIEMLDRIF